MKSFNYYAVTFNGEVYCNDCCPVDHDNEDVNPVFADSEWDYAPCCDKCGEVHDYMNILPDIDESMDGDHASGLASAGFG